MTPKDLGIRIKEARIASGLTQLQLALALGISDRSISAYENGKTFPQLENIFLLSDALEVPTTYFFSKDEDLTKEIVQLRNKINELERKTI